MSVLAMAVVLAWAAIVVLVWLGYQMVAQYGRVLLRLEGLERHLGELEGLTVADGFVPTETEGDGGDREGDAGWTEADSGYLIGLPIGTVLHDFELPDLSGRQHLRSSWLGARQLLVFVNPACRHSRALIADLRALRADPASTWPEPLLVSTGSQAENRQLFGEADPSYMVLLQEEMEVGSLFEVSATPMAYLVDEDGRTASPLVAGRIAILGLAASSGVDTDEALTAMPLPTDILSAVTTPAPVNGARYQHEGLGVGEVAPDFRLPGVNQDEVALGLFRGRPVLLVFTDPVRPPCEQLGPLLEQVHRAATGSPIVMISRGDQEANRAMASRLGLTMPIGLQRRWDLSRDYGLLATPIAFLVDERGAVARPVAIGADAILDLARH